LGEDPSPEPFWFKALSRLRPFLDAVKAEPLCREIGIIESELSGELYRAATEKDWRTAHDITGQLEELARFKALVCRK
jgi:hypothetical protein